MNKQPRRESNPHFRIRNPALYPLSYEAKTKGMFNITCEL